LSGFEVEGYFWYGSDGYDWQEEPQPDLEVRGRRLDGDAPALGAPAATNAHTDEFGSSMLTGVTIPTGGYWEITGEYGGESLAFVVRVSN